MIDVFLELARRLDTLIGLDISRITTCFGDLGGGDGVVRALSSGDGDVFLDEETGWRAGCWL